MGNERRPDLALNYAWEWFKYHAGQRVTAFHLYLVIIGVVIVGLGKAVELGSVGLGVAASVFGIITSLAFWFLDIRNTELVNCGRAALDTLMGELGLQIRKDDAGRKYLDRSLGTVSRLILGSVQGDQAQEEAQGRRKEPWQYKITRHQFWLRSIQGLALVFFLGTVLYIVAFPHAFMKASEAIRGQPERTRLAAAGLLNRVESLRLMLDHLVSLPVVARDPFDDMMIVGQARAVLILARDVYRECRRRPVLQDACKRYDEWSVLAIPILEQLGAAPPRPAQAVRGVLVTRAKDLQDRLATFSNELAGISEKAR